jgi:hypothetical protein
MKKETDEKGNLLTYWGGLDSNGVEKTKHLKRNKMEKQTAVEFLHSEYKKIIGDTQVTFAQMLKITDALEQAKEMEEQQIIDACEKMYSEEEVRNIVEQTIEKFYKHIYSDKTKSEMKELWFEQFKKK